MSLTVVNKVQFNGGGRGRKRIEPTDDRPAPDVAPGRVPRISRLMALAIEMQRMLDEGEVRNYAELARLAHVSRARITQIMNLNCLAPDIQEELLFLPLVREGREVVREREVRKLFGLLPWSKQRRLWTTCRLFH